MNAIPRTAFDFDVQPASPEAIPQKLIGDSLMIEHAEWLHMTLGPNVAPARQLPSGAIEYLLDGPEPVSEKSNNSIADLIELETSALESAIRRVDESLRLLGGQVMNDKGISLASTLLSIRMLLDVNLPDPTDKGALHLRSDRLQLSQWGLTKGTPIGQVVVQLRNPSSQSYTRVLRQTLQRKYHSHNASENRASLRQASYGISPPPNLVDRLPSTVRHKETKERFEFARGNNSGPNNSQSPNMNKWSVLFQFSMIFIILLSGIVLGWSLEHKLNQLEPRSTIYLTSVVVIMMAAFVIGLALGRRRSARAITRASSHLKAPERIGK